MGRVALTIACLGIGVLAVGAYFSAVADDPCNDQHRSTPAVALFIGAVVFGVAAYFLAERWTSRRWIPAMVLVATLCRDLLRARDDRPARLLGSSMRELRPEPGWAFQVDLSLFARMGRRVWDKRRQRIKTAIECGGLTAS